MRFRKKPVVIEARLYSGPSAHDAIELARWCGANIRVSSSGPSEFIIPTLEGNHTANPGDWIICGVKGEFYPCKPDIFEATYDVADDGESAFAEKTLDNSDISGARQNVPDIKVVGNGDLWQLLCKASSEREGWMKSSKAMQ